MSKKNNFLKDSRTIWIALGLLAIVVRSLASPAAIEQYYSRGLFVVIRHIFDVFTGIFPIALVYLLFVGLLVWIVRTIQRIRKDARPLKTKLGSALFSTLAFIFGVIFLFLVLWGFNYGRISVEEQMGFETTPLSLEELKMELDSTTKVLEILRKNVPQSSDSAFTASYLPIDLEPTMREVLTTTLKKYGFPTPGKVRGRKLLPRGILLRISTAGIYIPFTGEGHIDGGLHPIQLPFVMAHEMAHGYGFGDEGTCNFLAFLACIESDDALLRYIGYFSYWRYVASNYRRYEPAAYKDFYDKKVPLGVKNDLKAIYAEMDKYPDIFPAVRDAVYDNYLRAQGINEGIQNYSRILMLEKGRKNRTGKE